MRAGRTPFASLWGWPIALAVASSIGLVAALVGDGVWDAVSWFGLGLPVAVSAWYWLPRPRRPR
ncbi:MAG: hypothetical protein KA151_14650 [Piscinibacter sp.]|nr:hypothetical protein [Piscinibacter sp.]